MKKKQYKSNLKKMKIYVKKNKIAAAKSFSNSTMHHEKNILTRGRVIEQYLI